MFRFFEKIIPPERTEALLKSAGFGKIPPHGDFVRYNLAYRETTGFEKWLQEGVSCITRKYPKGWPDIFKEFPCHHFVMTGSDQEHNLMGSIAGSHDKSGRTYPFATLAMVTGDIFQKQRATLPLICHEYFAASRELFASLSDIPTAKALGSQLETLSGRFQQPVERDLLEQQIRLLSEHTMGDYWRGLPQALNATEREAFFYAFFDFLRTVTKRGPTKSHWGIRIPLPAGTDQTPLVIFWVQMIESILENRFWRAHYFWNAAPTEHGCHLTLFFRPLPPSHLLPLLDPISKDNVIFDVLTESRDVPDFASNIDLRRLLQKEETPLLQVLYRIGRRESLS